MTEQIELKLNNLPDSPGCYLMKNAGEVIYVGKAKNLKNRVRQYFQSSRGHTAKVQAMVDKVDDFDIVLVSGELEALILECTLIKRHQPYFNIMLRDDKQYPYIRLDMSDPYPRVDLVRRVQKDGARYFGPYFGTYAVRDMLDMVRQTFPIRTCTRIIREDKKQRPCLHHDINQCLAPCAGLTTPEEYAKVISGVIDLLSGRMDGVIGEITSRMEAAAAAMQYERAAMLRDRIETIKSIMQRQRAISTQGRDQDVLAVAQEGPDALVQAMYVRAGKLIGTEVFEMKRAGGEPPADTLAMFLLQYYDDAPMIPREILVMEPPPEIEIIAELLSEKRGGKLTLAAPRRGEKKQLMDLAVKNAQDSAQKRAQALERSFQRTTGALEQLAEVLGLNVPPRRIEAFDISNTQGALSVASMVVMLDGVSAKKEYRHFTIKTVQGPNDFASMREVVGRRLRHGLAEISDRAARELPAIGGKFSDMPDLILIDGGPIQLKYAQEAMREAGLSIPMFGLEERLEEIVLPGQSETILLDRHSDALHLIQRLRDEAHRFAITHHRKARAKAGVRSQLLEIPGVGDTRRRALLSHFTTLEKLREASVEELRAVPGMNQPSAEAVRGFFHPDEPT